MSSHAAIGAALLVLIPLTLLLGSRTGEAVPFLLAIITASVMVFIAPRVPGSPNACLLGHRPGNPCAKHMTAIWVLNVLAPLGVAVLWGTFREKRT